MTKTPARQSFRNPLRGDVALPSSPKPKVRTASVQSTSYDPAGAQAASADSSSRPSRLLRLCQFNLLFVVAMSCVQGQDGTPPAAAPLASAPVTADPAVPSPKPDKRAFGVVPNYRTVDPSAQHQPLTVRQKMSLAASDSLDWTIPIVAAGYAGFGQMTNSNPSFGQGMTGYGNRFVRVYADQVIGNMLVEGVMSSAFREDPRYFRRGQGPFWSRVGYAASRVFVTRTDSGRNRFNYSEVVGNATAVGISNAYYPDNRTVGSNFQRLTLQIATDALSNVLKEFWPDVKRKKIVSSPPSN